VFLLDGPKKALIERMDKAVLDVFQWLKVNDIPITLRKAARVSL
jgi:orotidine-5'-phosphate decarboxylase